MNESLTLKQTIEIRIYGHERTIKSLKNKTSILNKIRNKIDNFIDSKIEESDNKIKEIRERIKDLEEIKEKI